MKGHGSLLRGLTPSEAVDSVLGLPRAAGEPPTWTHAWRQEEELRRLRAWSVREHAAMVRAEVVAAVSVVAVVALVGLRLLGL